ncbi:hypothetical protein, conserved [Plasmodium gonderi]|uniref:Leucine-rich repeat protein n=1 Tax=Plasmodium gonderi TaxID=77519 RepID=A0A1Y1JJI0_PLAGO|nr:hypothetical protein, conserved [Plasmodium gonderi]GAW80613.1 hypothetical protein, conserved [Plasmodium gonderi]
MVAYSLTTEEQDSNFFNRVNFLKSNETNAYHSVESVFTSDDEEDREETNESDNVGRNSTNTSQGKKLKKEEFYLTQASINSCVPKSKKFKKYKNIVLSLKKFNENINCACDFDITHQYIEEQAKQKKTKKKKNKKKKRKASALSLAPSPFNNCRDLEKRCNTNKGKIQELQKYRLIRSIKKIVKRVQATVKTPSESKNFHHEQKINQEEHQPETHSMLNLLHQKGENKKGRNKNDYYINTHHHLLHRNHFIERVTKSKGNTCSCKFAINYIIPNMINNTDGTSILPLKDAHDGKASSEEDFKTMGKPRAQVKEEENHAHRYMYYKGIENTDESGTEVKIVFNEDASRVVGIAANEAMVGKGEKSEENEDMNENRGESENVNENRGESENVNENRGESEDFDENRGESENVNENRGGREDKNENQSEDEGIKNEKKNNERNNNAKMSDIQKGHTLSYNYDTMNRCAAFCSCGKGTEKFTYACEEAKGKSEKATCYNNGDTMFCRLLNNDVEICDVHNCDFLYDSNSGKIDVHYRCKEKQRSVQRRRTTENCLRGMGWGKKGQPIEYSCRKRILSSIGITNRMNIRNREILERLYGHGVAENYWNDKSLEIGSNKKSSGCPNSAGVLPMFKPVSNNDMDSTDNHGMFFRNFMKIQPKGGDHYNSSLRQGGCISRPSSIKTSYFVNKFEEISKNNERNTREGEFRNECRSVLHQERIITPISLDSTQNYIHVDVKEENENVENKDLVVQRFLDPLIVPFNSLKVNYDVVHDSSCSIAECVSGESEKRVENNHSIENLNERKKFDEEKNIFFDSIRNIIRIMNEIKKINRNLKIERRYSLVIHDKKKNEELNKLIDYLMYQKSIRKKLKKYYFEKINKGLFTFLLRSNRVNFLFSEEEVQLLKRWNQIKFMKMNRKTREGTSLGIFKNWNTVLDENLHRRWNNHTSSIYYRDCEPRAAREVYKRNILHDLNSLNSVLSHKTKKKEQPNNMKGINERAGLDNNPGEMHDEGSMDDVSSEICYHSKVQLRRGRKMVGHLRYQIKKEQIRDLVEYGYLRNRLGPISYESYFKYCEKSRRNIFNIFLCLKNINCRNVSKKFKKKLKSGQIYLSKIYDGSKVLSHIKYIFIELIKRNLPDIICLHINDCFINSSISFFISLLLIPFKNIHTIKIIRCHIYYAYLSSFIAYQKSNNLRYMHFICNSILWTNPPDFFNITRDMRADKYQKNFLLYLNTNYVRSRKIMDTNCTNGCVKAHDSGYFDSLKQRGLKNCLHKSECLNDVTMNQKNNTQALSQENRIILKTKKGIRFFGIDDFYDCFILKKGMDILSPVGEMLNEGFGSLDERRDEWTNEKGVVTMGYEQTKEIKNSNRWGDEKTNSYNIHSCSGSEENTSEDSLKEELNECVCTFPRKIIEQSNFTKLIKLKLCSNKLNDDALMYICTLIKKNKLCNLKVLDLRWNNFTYKSLLALSFALTNTTIISESNDMIKRKKQKLNKLLLSGNNIKSSLYSSFLSSFCTCNFLVVKKLDFSMNIIDNECFPITLKYFKHVLQLQKRNKKILKIYDVFINLDHNNLKNSIYINKLIQLFQKFPTKLCQENTKTASVQHTQFREEAHQGILLSLQYNNIKNGTLQDFPGAVSTSRVKF